MYGTSPLWRYWIDRCRARAEGPLVARRPISLAELRKELDVTQAELDVTQAELAARIGISQSDLSKLERRTDVRVSTLREYLAGLGGELRFEVEREGVRLPIEVGSVRAKG
jgi:transcriptional regulator with XRE-family HTH domain